MVIFVGFIVCVLKMKIHDLEFWSSDQRFGLKITAVQISKLLEICKCVGDQETGGIVIGFYTDLHNCAVVTDVSNAPQDSSSGSNWFQRGKYGLQEWLNHLWTRKRKQYYLGEWHFHPFSTPIPSQTDVIQMEQIANSDLYQCPEPLLLIIGGNPVDQWDLKIYAFPRSRPSLELKKLL